LVATESTSINWVKARKHAAIAARVAGVSVTLILAAATSAAPGEPPDLEPAPIRATELENFLAARGTSVVRDVYPVGSIRGLTLEAVVLHELGKESDKVKGIRVEVTEYGLATYTISSFVDADEIEGLLQAVDHMQRLCSRWESEKAGPYAEVMFVTRGNLRLGCYRRGAIRRIFASSGVIEKADFLGDPEELPKLHEMLERASDALGL
jgi:hypothetical protein